MALSVVGMEDRRWQVSPCVICLYLSRPPHPPQPLCSLVPHISAAAAHPSFPSVLTHPTPTHPPTHPHTHTHTHTHTHQEEAAKYDQATHEALTEIASNLSPGDSAPPVSPAEVHARSAHECVEVVMQCELVTTVVRTSARGPATGSTPLGGQGGWPGAGGASSNLTETVSRPPSLLALCTVNLSAPAPAPASDIRHPSDVCLPYLNACMIRVRALRGCGSVCGVHGYGFLCTASLRYMRHAPCMRTKHVCTSRWCQRHGGRFL